MRQRPHRSSNGDLPTIAAVVFDLDGVLLDSESIWEEERRQFVAAHGGRWQPDSQQRMMGMSTQEWGTYLSRELGVALPPQTVIAGVLQRVKQRYELELPLIGGAGEAVQRLAGRWPLGLASSSARPLIDFVLDRAHLASFFATAVSSDEVARGKPAPDVYLEAAHRLSVQPEACVAIEDSSNGLRAAAAAGMWVVAIPNAQYPPDADALAVANITVKSLHHMTVRTIEGLR